jgi:hypothetical protein
VSGPLWLRRFFAAVLRLVRVRSSLSTVPRNRNYSSSEASPLTAEVGGWLPLMTARPVRCILKVSEAVEGMR